MFIRDHVIVKWCAHGAWEAQMRDLNGGGPMCKNSGPSACRIASEINGDIHAILAGPLSRFLIGQTFNRDNLIGRRQDPLPHKIALFVIGRAHLIIGDHFEF